MISTNPNAVPRIADYALLGDCRSCALVSRTGSIDWFCAPRFDANAMFAALLGTEGNGFWRIAPTGGAGTPARRYRGDTMILETDWTVGGGRARVTDCMPIGSSGTSLLRVVEGLEGSVTFDVELVMRFDYGRTIPWVRRLGVDGLTAISGPDMLVLRGTADFRNEDMRTRATVTVGPGERHVFCLAHQLSWAPVEDGFDPDAALEETEAYWSAFAARCPEVDDLTQIVRRSLLTLKALTYAPTGGMVAAATTSLPETIGGGRNWDYRYCWLRDSSMMLMAFLELGYDDEAVRWRDWLLRAVAGDPSQMQIMYGLAGERTLVEWEAGWLPGFRDSAPVRIGNAAAGQFQLDVYGEVSEMLAMAREGGLTSHGEAGNLLGTFLPFLEDHWSDPDDGIWEMRGERRQYVHSKVLAWVAFDRAARQEDMAEEDRAHWRAVADAIHADVCEKGYDAEAETFVQSYGATAVDASLLQLVLTGFLPPEDPRAIGTVAAVERHLVKDGFVARYDTGATDDGVSSGEEGAFLICTFWLIDAYVLMGRTEDARRLYGKMAGLLERRGAAVGGVRPRDGRDAGQLPSGVQPCGSDPFGHEPVARRGPRGQARGGGRARGDGRAAGVSRTAPMRFRCPVGPY